MLAKVFGINRNKRSQSPKYAAFLKHQVQSILMTGIQAQASDSVILLFGNKKGQFSVETKSTLLRFRPLLERAISDIEHKEALQKLVDVKTRELVAAQKLAEQASESKSKFLAMMSHELRTPLNAVLGLIDVLREDSSRYQLELLEQMESSAELLLVIINDILDLSKIESGHFILNPQWVNLADKLHHALEYHQAHASAKGIDFRLETRLCSRTEYLIDNVRLTQILFNVVGNAVKFTRNGYVSVKLDTEQDILYIEVEDSGIGIDRQDIEQIFTPFVQADSSVTRTFGGTGLGLAITKHLVSLMNGRIRVSSTRGKGSLFTIEIPLEEKKYRIEMAAEVVISGELSNDSEKTHHILVVEDTKTNQMVIKLILNRLGYNVTIAENGQEAIDYCEKEHNFSLILMDVSMPVVDGIQATKVISQSNPSLPIIALTAHAMGNEQEACMQAGMKDILLKPVRSQAIKEVIERYLHPVSH